MAQTPTSSAHLTAAGAVGVGLVAATFIVDGPWQPISVVSGWLAVLFLVASVVWGRPVGLMVAAALQVARVGVHGIAGERTPGLVVSAVLLVAMVELAAASFEARQMPLPFDTALARSILLAAVAGLAVGLVAVGVRSTPVTGAGAAIIGLVAALSAAGLLVWLARPSGPD
jgi:hypothetical protein